MKLKIVSSQSAEWEMAGANTIASSVLSEHPGVKAILCANDSMALGALAAVKSAGKSGDVRIVGFDNIAAVRQAIQNGDILATVDQHGAELAVFGIEAALKFIDSDSATVADQETPVDVVTANSL
jgi:ribose transport system substrate-binding protein